MLALIEKEWSKNTELNKFKSFFWKNYVDKNNCWANCFRRPNMQITNNCIEGFNHKIKIQVTQHQKLELGELINKLGKFIETDLNVENEGAIEIDFQIDKNIWELSLSISQVGILLFTEYE